MEGEGICKIVPSWPGSGHAYNAAMVINVLVVIQTDGRFVASSQEFPDLEASGVDENEFSRSLIEAFWGCLGARAAQGQDLEHEEIRLQVHHLGPDPRKAREMDWEVVMPKHTHERE